MKQNIAIICGGKSPEHEISFLSVKNIVAALDLERFDLTLIAISKQGSWYHFTDTKVLTGLKSLSDEKIPAGLEPAGFVTLKGRSVLHLLNSNKQLTVDAIFPVMHGSFGEDGTVQGLVRMLGLPLVGCDVFCSAASMDKEVMKRLFSQAQIPTARFVCLTPQNSKSYDDLSKELGTPFFIKPANAGSSVGVHKIKSAGDFDKKLRDAFLYDSKVLAEEFIEGREIECAVLGHTFQAKASLAGEVIPTHEFYSYEAKYLDENGAAVKIPADLRPDTLKTVQQIAVKVFETMLCEGLTRVDFFIRKNGDVLVNELNTMPGFTNISMYPKMWEASGLSNKNLVTKLIDLAFEKFQADRQIETNFKDLTDKI